MEKKVNYSGIAVVVLAAAILVMSVGFAAYSSTLNINGSAAVSSAKWLVQFDDASFQETVGSVETTEEPTINGTSVTYSVALEKPGDFYEFTIDVENGGTFDAQLDSITMTDISEHANYLKYTLTYDGVEYTPTSLTTGLPKTLTAGSRAEDVKVRVEYIQPSSADQLPTELKNVTLNATLNYSQKTA